MPKYTFGKLVEHTGEWRNKRTKGSVVAVFADITLLLSLSGIISSFLFGGHRPSSTSRAERLRALLAVGELPLLQSREVRNALLHTDERLDALLPSIGDRGFSPFWIAEDLPTDGRVFLKRLDPQRLILWSVPADATSRSFREVSIDLRALMAEIEDVEAAANTAMHRLHGDKFVIWQDRQ